MSPLDIAVMFFFVLIAGKALAGSFNFWKEQERLAELDHELAVINAKSRVSTAKNNTVRVTRTQYRVYHRVDNKVSASAPAPRKEYLHSGRGAGRQIPAAA